MTKKVLSLVLSVLLIMNVAAMAISAAPAPDVKGTAFEKAATILTDMGIMSLKQDGKFDVAGDITVGEFMDPVLKLIGVDASNATAGSRFSDVPASHTYAKQIEMACQLGVYNGLSADKFGADDKLTVGVAIQAILNATGYGEYAKVKGGYPYGYSVVAAERDILDKFTSESVVVTRGLAADMIYNALFLNVMVPTSENGNIKYKEDTSRTILSSIFSAYKIEGIVKANSFVTLPAGKGLPQGNIAIEYKYLGEFYRDVYATGNIKADMYLGYNVTAIYTTNKGYRNLIAISSEGTKNKVETFDLKDVTRIATDKVVYFPDSANKEEEYTLEQFAPVLDNFKTAALNDNFDYKIPDLGEITLIDNNNDGYYDVVLIDSYKTMVISSVDKINTTLYGKFSYSTAVAAELEQYASNSVDLSDYKKYIIKDPTGKIVKLSDIAKNDVAIIKTYPDEELAEIQLVRTKETVTVDEITQSGTATYPNKVKFKSGDKEYTVAASYYKASGTSEIQIGGKYEVSLDSKGNIANMIQKIDDTLQYGYLVKGLISKNGVDQTLEVKIYTLAGTFITVKSGEKLLYSGAGTVNGASKTYSQVKLPFETVHELLFSNSGIKAGSYSLDSLIGATAIRYRVSSDNILTAIETPYNSTFVDGFRIAGQIGTGERRYKKTSKLIGGVIMMGDDTKVVDVSNLSEYDKEANYSNRSSIVNEEYYTNLFAYSSTLDNASAQFIVHRTAEATGTIDENDPAYVFVKYVEAYDPKTEKRGQNIVLYEDGELVSHAVDQDVVDTDGYFKVAGYKMQPGDIIRPVYNGEDEIMSGTEVMFKASTRTGANNREDLVEGVVTFYGKMFRRLGNGGYGSTNGGISPTASIFNFDSAKNVVVVDLNEDREARKFTQGSVDDIKTVYEVGKDMASNVFAFIREGNFKLVVIYK